MGRHGVKFLKITTVRVRYMTVFKLFPFLPSCFQKGIRCGCGDEFESRWWYIRDRSTGTELGVEVESGEACVRSKSVDFRDLFGGAGLAEARMSAALVGMGCIGQPSTQKYAMSDCPGIFSVYRTGLFRGG
jgi:hypothetical protein